MNSAMRLVIGLALAGVLLALASPWIHEAIVVARLLEDGGLPLPSAEVQTAVDAHAPPDAVDLSSPSLMLRPRHLR